MSLRLRIEHGQDAGKTWRLPKPGVYTLGRSTGNSIRILDMKVSKTHCEIRVAVSGGRVRAVFHDNGSTHGSTLNGQPVAKDMPLTAGDELRLGLTIARILSDGEADADAQPVAGRDVDDSSVEAANGPGGGDTKQTLPPDALVGMTLGGYAIERKIGAGGMGGVYLAEQMSLHRKVALKVLNEKFASDSAFVDQFENEARAAGALNHPNVVQVYDVGSDQGHYYFSMEVMPGGSIEDRVREGPVAWEQALNWFLDSANALIFAKRREILHRDVKPDNLMIGEDGSAKLCDLGLAKKSEVSDLMDQGIIGTPHFISPEAIRRKPDVDHRTDLYSLGCTFFRVFSGQNPYPAGTIKEILLGHLNKPVPRVSAVNRDVPREIDEVIYQLMQKDPAERIQSPEDLLRELDRVRTQYNLEAHGLRPGSRKPLIIGIAAALIALGVAIFIIATQEDKIQVTVLSADEQAQIDQAERDKLRSGLATYATDAQSKLSDLKLQFAEGALGPKNYTLAKWATLAEEYKTNAESWQSKLDEWGAAAGKEPDEVKKKHYGTFAAELAKHIEAARSAARDEIEEPIKRLTARAASRKTAIEAAQQDAETQIKAFAEKLKKMLEDGDYVGLESTLKKDEETKKNALDLIVDKLLAAELDGFSLLDADDIKPLLDRYLPVSDKQERGESALQEGLRRLGATFGGVMNDVAQALGQGTPDHDGYQGAWKALDTFLESLPADLDDAAQLKAAPQVVARLREHRDKAAKTKKDVLEADGKLWLAELAADNKAYHELLVALYRPGRGFLQVFDFAAARAQQKTTAAKIKVAGYKQVVDAWALRIDALDGIFQHLISAHPSGWIDDDFVYLDDKGKERKGKIRGIDARGVEWEREKVPFAATGSRELLDKLFFFEGKARWGTECSAQDHLGLALLAEMAGRYDIAVSQYKAAQTGFGNEPGAQQVMDRMGELGLEKQAAEKFWAIYDFELRVRGWVAPWEAKQEAAEGKGGADPDPDAFPPDERGRALEESRPYLKDIESIWQMHADLGKKDLAGTWLGAALRDEAHPEVKYAGR